MIFTPYPHESTVINTILQIRNTDYALLRLTPTMIKKNIIDANTIFRNLLCRSGIVDYEDLDSGRDNGVEHFAKLIQKGSVENIKMKFYRVSNRRGDRRFSIEKLKRKTLNNTLNEGDLLYIAACKTQEGSPQLFLIDLSNNTPTPEEIFNAIGKDDTLTLLDILKPRLVEILHGGFYDNSKGSGLDSPKDIGDTLERLLEIDANNRNNADYKGLIEIKAKGEATTRDTLFTLRPSFEGTPIALYEPTDRYRVSAFTRYYGYASEKHPDACNLYITIGSFDAPQNNQGFYLDVDEEQEKVLLVHIENSTKTTVAYWSFNKLETALTEKHPATLWFKGEKRQKGDVIQFKYNEVEFTRSPQFMTFLSLIKRGLITYDWRGYTTKEGKYSGKNHGNAWRIKPHYRKELFGSIEKLSL